jgi:hypothetical protein
MNIHSNRKLLVLALLGWVIVVVLMLAYRFVKKTAIPAGPPIESPKMIAPREEVEQQPAPELPTPIASKDPCKEASIAFRKASKVDTVSGYDDFINLFPGCPSISQRAKQAKIDAALRGESFEGLQSVLKDCVDDACRERIHDRIAELEFMRVSGLNSVSELRAFIDRHKGSRYEAIVRERLAKLEYDRVVQSNSIEELDKYLREFPNSQYSEDIRRRRNELIDNRDWAQAVESKSFQSLMAYYSAHPASPRIKSTTGTIAGDFVRVNGTRPARVKIEPPAILVTVAGSTSVTAFTDSAHAKKWGLVEFEVVAKTSDGRSVIKPISNSKISDATLLYIEIEGDRIALGLKRP